MFETSQVPEVARGEVADDIVLGESHSLVSVLIGW